MTTTLDPWALPFARRWAFAIVLAAVTSPLAGVRAMQVTFLPRATYESASSQPAQIAAADLDGDKWLDIVVAASGEKDPGEIGLLLNTGTGFNDDSIATTFKPWGLAVEDFTGDTCPDILVTNSGNAATDVHAYQNNCNAAFLPLPQPPNANTFPVGIVMEHFNADSMLDAVIACNTGPSPVILLGAPGGTFVPGTSPMGPLSNATGIAHADFDRDTLADVVLSAYAGGRVYYGNGDGSFAPGPFIGNNQINTDVAVGDFNHDGWPDIACVEAYSGHALVNINDGSGGFHPTFTVPASTAYARHVACGDLNRDGYDEIVVTDLSTHRAVVLVNDTAGGFNSPMFLTTGFRRSRSSLPTSTTTSDSILQSRSETWAR